LFKAGLLRLSDDEHILIFSLDHIITDSLSNSIISREIWTLYNQAEQGQPLSMPELPVQFADYAVWQEWTYEAWRQSHEKYWRQKLLDAPCTQLPVDTGVPQRNGEVGALLHVDFGKPLSARLRQIARSKRVTVSLAMLTIYIAVMSRWCNQQDVVIGMLDNGRWCSQLVDIVGFLVNMLFLRVRVTPADSFQNLLEKVAEEYYSACDHQDFNRVMVDIQGCIPSGQWLEFNWLDTDWLKCPGGPVRNIDQLRIEPFSFDRTIVAYKLNAWFSDTSSGIGAMLGYNPGLVAESTISKVGRNLRHFSEEFAARPTTRLTSLQMVS